ncbi:dipeptide epimerase [Metabacillus sp. GX 13764]|uniref:dipeptide epimerase n=1 Tax=Metabacillus kandeliae TaxID=2900151 RepID=UPI001E3FAFED|nr:dipeptide epimerase [Metabacillus kandeliae]MCD7035068.1 dipeptide epimerase [Metabacillus kandeliae]
MIIESLQTSLVKIPLNKPFKTALRTAVEVETIFVEIGFSCGLKGYGSASPTPAITGETAEGIAAALNGPIKQALIGKDLRDFHEAAGSLKSSCIGNTSAKAAADIALYDGAARKWNIPLHTLLGGRKPLIPSMTISADTPDKMAQDAKQSIEQGYSILKVKLGTSPEEDLERMLAVKSAIPDEVLLRADANQAWDPKQAAELINEMTASVKGIQFIEQPVKADDWDGLKYVKEHVSIPVMADESIFTSEDALKLAAGKFADMINIKLMKSGGIAEAWKIASAAEAAGVPCMVGSMMEHSLSVCAAAHFASAHPNVKFADLDAPLWLTEEPWGMDYEKGKINLWETAGIGIAMEALKR